MTGPAGRFTTLNDEMLLRGVQQLNERDTQLAAITHAYGPPPLWARPPGFASLIRIILEQQVSLASAKAAFDRLCLVASPLTPEAFEQLDDATLRTAGFSRQKTRYGRELARALTTGQLDLAFLEGLDDDGVREQLTRITGIGRWTADIYLVMAMLRPDVWPHGDLGLLVGAREALDLETTPSNAWLAERALNWQPWRAVAARLFWHAYLSKRAK